MWGGADLSPSPARCIRRTLVGTSSSKRSRRLARMVGVSPYRSAMTDPIRRSERGVAIDVLVVPNASSSEVVGMHGDRIKVRIACPPERGRANTELIATVKSRFGVRRAEVTAGRTTRWKTVELIGADVDRVTRALAGP